MNIKCGVSVRRWFSPTSYVGPSQEMVGTAWKQMVVTSGFGGHQEGRGRAAAQHSVVRRKAPPSPGSVAPRVRNSGSGIATKLVFWEASFIIEFHFS